jgi:hypothetical protein
VLLPAVRDRAGHYPHHLRPGPDRAPGTRRQLAEASHLGKPANEATLAAIETEVERRWLRLKARDENPLL